MESNAGNRWKLEAEDYYYRMHKPMTETAALVGKTRQAVSAYIKTLPGYMAEKELRKKKNAEKRKAYKQEKNREYRKQYTGGSITAETLKREHDLAALVLSREKY